MNDHLLAVLHRNLIYLPILVVIMLAARGCEPAYAQYTISEMEKNCSEEFSPEQVMQCTYTQRINLGVYTMKQMPYLVELHLWYRDQGEWEDATNLVYQMRWLITKNNFDGANELVNTLTWIPDDNFCFEKDDWQYTKWSKGCEELRYYVVDCFILATGIAEGVEDWKAVQLLAMATSRLSLGVTGENVYSITRDFRYELNLNIPSKYRSDLWMIKSNRAKDKI